MSDGGSASVAGQGPPVLVVGVGNELRRDDGAGIAVVRRLCIPAEARGIDVEEEQNDPTALIERWRDRRAVVVVDALDAGTPGSLHRWDASSQPLPCRRRGSSSSHAVGVAEAIELARALGRLPPRVVIYAVSGHRFEAGSGFSEEVAVVLPELADRVRAEALRLAGDITGSLPAEGRP
ncbi:MAG: hydrogenase maturation protease [Solirubrobacterales bacterium]|nr:hydrogenase maturation protease [Solirubrobacterales bacterium]